MNPTSTHLDPNTPASTVAETPANDRAALLALLHNVPILASLSEDDLHCLDDIEQIHANRGDLLAKQGDAAEYFFVILAGSIRIFFHKPDGAEVTAVSLPAGSAYGELPLLAGIQNPTSVEAEQATHLLRFTEEEFWELMTSCPMVRKAILGNMAFRLQRFQNHTLQQEKMAALGTLAAGLMHELNNPGAAARRAASQLRENLMQLHELSAKFTYLELDFGQKKCLMDLQTQAISVKQPLQLNSLEQSDAEESLAEWMESAHVSNAWKLAPTLVSVGVNQQDLVCAHTAFNSEVFSDALNWLDALVSSMQLVTTIEESIGRVSTLVAAVKSYAYEGKGQRQTTNVNESIYATLVILGHKIREKQLVLEKKLDLSLPPIESFSTGLNQVWTNILDNAIDALPQQGHLRLRTWSEQHANGNLELCVSIEDDGPGIPLEVQPHIFDPFYTTKPVGVGTGLGLGIAHRIVEQYGGTIRFTSGPGSTVFFVRLPTKQPQTT